MVGPIAFAWPIIVRAGLSTATAYLVGKVLLVNLQRQWREHLAHQREIADRLDSTTPGGITDLLDKQ